jgi:hypothetical protein
MIYNILLCLIFSVLINWSISLQFLNQVSEDKRTKIVSVVLAVISTFLAGLLLLI